jgi:hypothetical protein
MPRPKCFSSDDRFESYMEALRKTTKDPRATFCWDCTPAHKQDMIDEGDARIQTYSS